MRQYGIRYLLPHDIILITVRDLRNFLTFKTSIFAHLQIETLHFFKKDDFEDEQKWTMDAQSWNMPE